MLLEGVYQWGKDSNRKIIDQMKLTNKEHLRRLSPGQKRSPRARPIAELYGVRLPERFTFVRPAQNKYEVPEGLSVAGLANLVVCVGGRERLAWLVK